MTHRPHHTFALLCALVASCLPPRVEAQTPAPANEPRLVISFADVGQGDAALIRTPRGKHILIDAGPSDAAAARMFFEFLPDTLDLVIASHNHADHIGGMPWVFNRFVVRSYMDNGIAHTTNIYRRTLAAAEREPGLQYLQATERTVVLDSVSVRILPPPRLDATHNNNSVGVLVQYGLFSALLTGDSERKELAHWVANDKIRRVTVLKAAHHGASNGMTAAFVRAAVPRLVVVSVGAGNRYGHPSPAVLQAWRAAGARIHRTDVDGPLFLVATPDGKYVVPGVLSAPIRR